MFSGKGFVGIGDFDGIGSDFIDGERITDGSSPVVGWSECPFSLIGNLIVLC
jgi:hypothetical protein